MSILKKKITSSFYIYFLKLKTQKYIPAKPEKNLINKQADCLNKWGDCLNEGGK